jgi:hypothetical protein
MNINMIQIRTLCMLQKEGILIIIHLIYNLVETKHLVILINNRTTYSNFYAKCAVDYYDIGKPK